MGSGVGGGGVVAREDDAEVRKWQFVRVGGCGEWEFLRRLMSWALV